MTQINRFNQTIQQTEPLPKHIQEKIVNSEGGYFMTPAMWYNPESDTIHEGEWSPGEPRFDNDNVIMNVGKARAAQKRYAEQHDLRGVETAGISDNLYSAMDNYLDMRKAFRSGDRHLNSIEQAAILKREDYLYVKTLMAESNVILAIPPEHNLLQAVTVTPTSQTQYKWYKMDGGQFDVVNEDIDELTVPWTGAPAFTTDTAALRLFGTHSASTWEFRNERYDIDVENITLRYYAGQMDRKKHEIVARLINAIGGTGAADWDAVVAGANTNNPTVDIDLAIDTIVAKNKGSPTEFISNRKPERAFMASTPFVARSPLGAAVVNAIPYSSGINYTVGAIPLYGGFKWVVDSFITDEEVTIMSQEAIRFFDGPDRTISYANTQTEIEGVINKSYFDAKVIDTDLIYKMTSVLS
jgi:hypothetical protein